MPRKRSRWPTWATLVAVTALALLGWFGGLYALWSILRAAGHGADPWAMTEALSTAVAAAAVFSGGFVAYRELREQDRSRHIQVADRLFTELNAPENIEARRWVFQHLPDDPRTSIHTLSEEGRLAIKRVLNGLDRAAFVTQAGWIPDELIMPWINPMVVKAWAKLGPYVAYESERRKEPDYYHMVRALAERCAAWRAEHVPDARITWLDDAL